MKNRFPVLLAASLLIWVAGCRSTGLSPEEEARLRSSDAGEIILKSLERQGFADWNGEQGLTIHLRSRGEDGVEDKEILSCDIVNQRVHSRSEEGPDGVERCFNGETYWESDGGGRSGDLDAQVENRRRLLDDYFFTALPFLPVRLPVALDGVATERISDVAYYVTDVEFIDVQALIPAATVRLYYTASTHRLEKAFYQAREGRHQARYIWCEYDNFAHIDGVLLPVHRTFTLADDRTGLKGEDTGPFLEQWLTELTLGGIKNELFR